MPTVTRIHALSGPDSVKLAERIAARTVEDGDCWRWIGAIDKDGYGKVAFGYRRLGTHRIAWLAYRGEIPPDLVIDHLCRNRWCVNPWHMDLVTNEVNTHRGIAGHMGTRVPKSGPMPPPKAPKAPPEPVEKPARRPRVLKTHCAQGHLRTPENAYQRPNTKRPGGLITICRVCRREEKRREAEALRRKSGELAS